MKAATQTVIVASLLASTVSTQQQYTIDPGTVDSATRDFWCQQQTSQCPLICLDQGSSTGSTNTNDCSPDSLTYSCVCDNGLSPNISQYSNTLPYWLCTAWGNQCVSNCGADTTCSGACRQDHPCGAQNPTRQNTSTLSRTMSATASRTGAMAGQVTTDADGSPVTIYSGFGEATGKKNGGDRGGNGNGGSSSAAASLHVRVWALSAGQTFGSLALGGAAVLGFAVLL